MTTTRFMFLAFCLLLAGCSDKAKDLLETAYFEEAQSNFPHAKEIYEELVRLYPSSKEAEIARARIVDLGNRQ